MGSRLRSCIRPAAIVILLPTARVLTVNVAILACVQVVVLALGNEAAIPIGSVITGAACSFRGSEARRSPIRVSSMRGLRQLVAPYRDGTPPIAIGVRTLTRRAIHTGIRVVAARRGRTPIRSVG